DGGRPDGPRCRAGRAAARGPVHVVPASVPPPAARGGVADRDRNGPGLDRPLPVPARCLRGLHAVRPCDRRSRRRLPHKGWLLIFGAVLGFVTTWGEPAVRVLADQVEQASAGSIRQGMVLVTVC